MLRDTKLLGGTRPLWETKLLGGTRLLWHSKLRGDTNTLLVIRRKLTGDSTKLSILQRADLSRNGRSELTRDLILWSCASVPCDLTVGRVAKLILVLWLLLLIMSEAVGTTSEEDAPYLLVLSLPIKYVAPHPAQDVRCELSEA